MCRIPVDCRAPVCHPLPPIQCGGDNTYASDMRFFELCQHWTGGRGSE